MSHGPRRAERAGEGRPYGPAEPPGRPAAYLPVTHTPPGKGGPTPGGGMERWIGRWLQEQTGQRARRSAVSTTGAKPWVRGDDSVVCPVPEDERAWIERRLDWCVAQFGEAALRRDIVLPGPRFAPPGFDGTQGRTEELVAAVCGVMGVAAQSLTVHLFETSGSERARRHVVGTYRRVLGRSLIELDRSEAVRPVGFTGVIAHELAHVRLLGEDRIDPGEEDGERLTDLLTVFLGMGIFTANSAYRFPRSPAAQGYTVRPLGDLTDRMLTGLAANEPSYRTGYLSEREFGYALAYWCVLRGEHEPDWTGRLEAGVRDVLIRGLAHLAARPR